MSDAIDDITAALMEGIYTKLRERLPNNDIDYSFVGITVWVGADRRSVTILPDKATLIIISGSATNNLKILDLTDPETTMDKIFEVVKSMMGEMTEPY